MRRVVLLVVGLAVVGFVPSLQAQGGPRARQKWGFLQVNSLTDGAEVFVDGQRVGVIPLDDPVKLPVGRHTLKMTLRGYTDYLDVFTIERKKTTTLEIDLLPYAGVLQITSNVAKARVFIDGKFEGLTPFEKEVLIGKRAVRVRMAGYHEHIGQVTSVAGKTLRLHVTLKAMPVGSTPYRPPPPPPAKWYERWYVWVGGAAGVAAVTAAIVVPVVLVSRDAFEDRASGADHRYSAKGVE